MVRSLALFPFVAIAWLSQAPSNPTSCGTPLRANSALQPDLQRAWEHFAQAVQANDLPALRQLSASCIQCTDCVTNTEDEKQAFDAYTEQHPDTWYDGLYQSLSFIPAEDFWRQDAPLIFDAITKVRLRNPTKLRFAGNEHNKAAYVAPCLISPTHAAMAPVDEVLLTYVDPSPKWEGMQKAFAFVKTKQGYKFCGYSTIP